jgi:hypothetical protein
MRLWGKFGAGWIGLWVLCFAVVLCGAVGWAQTDTGSLSGTVTDSSGGVVTGAQVKARDQLSGTEYKTVTSSSGEYVFSSVRPGSYMVSVTAATFKVQQVTALPVYVSTRATQNFVLAPGAASETVTVDAQGPSLEMATSDVGTVITSQQVEELPLTAGGNIRTISDLVFLTPGAVGPGTNGGTTYTKIGGGQTEGSDILIDGISTLRSENGSGEIDQDTPPPDSIQEFRVDTFSLPAYFGRTTGGIANYKTRAGTNGYHGTVYDYFKNKIFDANSWFNKGDAALNDTTQNGTSYQRPVDTHNDYGVTLGGPVVIPHLYNGRDRTFFFFGFDKVPSEFGYVSNSVVPTLAERGQANGSNGTVGDFSSFLGGAIPNEINPCTGQPVLYGQIYDPSTTATVSSGSNTVECRTPFANNQVPLGRSMVAQKVLAMIPLPNETNAGLNNYIFTGTQKVVQTVYTLRVDQNFGTRNHIFGFGSARENFSGGDLNFPGAINSGSNQQDLLTKYLRLGWDFTITPHIVNSLTFGANRTNSFNDAPITSQGSDWDTQLGIPNTPGAGTTFPTFAIGEGITAIGSANFDDNVDNALILDDNVTWQKGEHTIQFGGLYRWQQFSYINSGPAAGAFNFADSQTAADNVDATVESQSGNSLASFLLGAPSGTGRTVQLQAPRWLSYYLAGYIQDDWKIARGLTLNLGFRYSVDAPRHEASGDISSFDPNTPNPEADGILGALKFGGVGPGRDGNKNETFADTFHKNFEPRLGFAYAPPWMNNKVVLRGAYAIMYGPLVYSDFGQGLNQGFTVTAPSLNTNGFVSYGTLDGGPTSVPTMPNLDPGQLDGGTTNEDYVEKTDGKPGMVQNYSLEVQTELAPDLVLTTGFLGQHSTRLRSLVFWANSVNPSEFGLGNLLTQPITSPSAIAAGITSPFASFTTLTGGNDLVGQALLPYPQLGYLNNDSYLQNRGQADYDALEVKLDRKFRNGLNLLASYTWSKTLTDADSVQPYYATVLGQGGTQNPFDLKAEKNVSTQDVPTNFVISYLYDLPVGKGKKFLGNSNKVVNAMIGGYRIGGIDRYVSGQPVSFFGAEGIPFFDGAPRFDKVVGQNFDTPAGGSGHYDPLSYMSPPDNNPSNYNPTGVYSRNAFADVNDSTHRGTGAYGFGNLPRNEALVRTAAYFNEDANINKHFDVREGIGADLRFEVFNVLNRHVFGKPDSGVNDLTFGQITALNDSPRTAQLVLKLRF